MLQKSKKKMSDEPTQQPMFIFKEYGIPVGSNKIDPITSSEAETVKKWLQTIWKGEKITLGNQSTLAEGQASPSGENVSVFVQTVLVDDQSNESNKLVFGYTAYRKPTTNLPQHRPKQKMVTMDNEAVYQKAYIFVYSADDFLIYF